MWVMIYEWKNTIHCLQKNNNKKLCMYIYSTIDKYRPPINLLTVQLLSDLSTYEHNTTFVK